MQIFASVAQSVEQLICNQRVGGSNPLAGSKRIVLVCRKRQWFFGSEWAGTKVWPNGAGCKPAAVTLRRFESFPAHRMRGNSSVGRASAFQADCRGFESRFPLLDAHVAQSVEHVLGKDGVTSSSLVVGFDLIERSINDDEEVKEWRSKNLSGRSRI
jgi:hypothetical protein